MVVLLLVLCGGAAVSDIAGVGYGSISAGSVAGYYVSGEAASYVLVVLLGKEVLVLAFLVVEAMVVDIGGGSGD